MGTMMTLARAVATSSLMKEEPEEENVVFRVKVRGIEDRNFDSGKCVSDVTEGEG